MHNVGGPGPVNLMVRGEKTVCIRLRATKSPRPCDEVLNQGKNIPPTYHS